jgi:MFS family permease
VRRPAALSVISLQFVDSLWIWAILRAAFGASMAPLFVIGEAWINSLPGDASRGRVVAIYTTSFTLCQVFGPLLTDVLTHVPRQAFLICGAVFLLGIPGIASARDAAPAAPTRERTPGATSLTTTTRRSTKKTAQPPGGPLSAWHRPSSPAPACSPPSTTLF